MPVPGDAEPVEDWQEYVPKVHEYLAYCEQSSAWIEARGSNLDPRYHPTADGAVKMIAHDGNPAKAQLIRQAFRELVGGQA